LAEFFCRTQDGYALGEGAGEGSFEVAFEAHAGSQQATLASGQVAYIATGGRDIVAEPSGEISSREWPL
jgi:hypothetical protein